MIELQNFHKSEKGLTLIEVLASIVLLSIVIVSFLSLFPQITNFNKSTEENLQAAATAKEVRVLVKQEIESLDSFPSNLSFTNERTLNNDVYLYKGKYNDFEVFIEVHDQPFVGDEPLRNEIRNLYKYKVSVGHSNTRILSTTYGFISKNTPN